MTKTTEQTSTKHTPTPWAFDYDRNNDRFILRGRGSFGHFQGWSADGVTTADEDKDNAAFIVRAVNSHEELIKACEELLECDRDNPDVMHNHWTERCKAKLRAAIANAKA